MADELDKQLRAEEAVRNIVRDLTDRNGLQNEWDNIDIEIHDEIQDTWAKIIFRAVS